MSASAYAAFKTMLSATETGKWLESHCSSEWTAFRPESFSIDGRMRGEVSTKNMEEAEALAAICRKDRFSVSIVQRTNRHTPHGKERQGWGVRFSRERHP